MITGSGNFFSSFLRTLFFSFVFFFFGIQCLGILFFGRVDSFFYISCLVSTGLSIWTEQWHPWWVQHSTVKTPIVGAYITRAMMIFNCTSTSLESVSLLLFTATCTRIAYRKVSTALMYIILNKSRIIQVQCTLQHVSSWNGNRHVQHIVLHLNNFDLLQFHGFPKDTSNTSSLARLLLLMI